LDVLVRGQDNQMVQQLYANMGKFGWYSGTKRVLVSLKWVQLKLAKSSLVNWQAFLNGETQS